MTLIAMLLVAAQATASGGPKPDFSGQWVLNAAESDFGLISQSCGLMPIRYPTDGTLVTYMPTMCADGRG